MLLKGLMVLCVAVAAGVVSGVERERTSVRRVQMEYLARQDYALRLEREAEKLVRGGKLTTPEVEALRAQRQALMEQVKALDEQIAEASRKAPEVLELQALGKANEERLAVLREAILPLLAPQPPAEEAPVQEAVSQ